MNFKPGRESAIISNLQYLRNLVCGGRGPAYSPAGTTFPEISGLRSKRHSETPTLFEDACDGVALFSGSALNLAPFPISGAIAFVFGSRCFE